MYPKNPVRHFTTLSIAVAAALATLVGPSVQAQVLEEVIVTAQKREQNLQDVGISVTAYTGDQMKALGVTNTVEISDQVPGVIALTRCGPVHHNLAIQAAPIAYPHHIAFEVDSYEALMAHKAKLEQHGVDVVGPTNHGIFDSIYFFEPNGHRLELAANKGKPEQLEALKAVSEPMLNEWSQTKKAPKHADWLHEYPVLV